MDDRMKIVLVVAVLVVIGLPILGHLGGQAKTPENAPSAAPQAANPAPNASAPKAPQVAPPPQPKQAPQAPPPPPPPPRPQGPPPPLLNADNLANSAWIISTPQYGDITVQLFAGGSATAYSPMAPVPIQGNWSVSGSNVNVSAMGQSLSVKIVGDTLVYNGVTISRAR